MGAGCEEAKFDAIQTRDGGGDGDEATGSCLARCQTQLLSLCLARRRSTHGSAGQVSRFGVFFALVISFSAKRIFIRQRMRSNYMIDYNPEQLENVKSLKYTGIN